MTNLLIHEPPLMVLPSLASKIGLNEAIVLQQIHYWLSPTNNKNFEDGVYWVYNTYKNWQIQFPFWSEKTIFRVITNLEKIGLLISKTKDSFQKIKWYSIDYAVLNQLNINLIKHKRTNSLSSQNDQTRMTSCPDRLDKVTRRIYIDAENTTKTTTNSLSLKHLGKIEEETNGVLRESEMIKIWNELVEDGNNIVKLTANRKTLLLKQLRNFFNNDLTSWKNYCLKISSSKFLMGEITKFKAHLDWALKDENIIKILENTYGVGDRNVSDQKQILGIEDYGTMMEINALDSPQLLKDIRISLLQELGEATYKSWFQNLELVSCNNGIVELSVKSRFIKEYVLQNFQLRLNIICRKIIKDFSTINITHGA